MGGNGGGAGKLGEGRGLPGCVDGAVFRGIGQGQGTGLDIVDPEQAGGGDGLFKRGGIKFGVVPIDEGEFAATGEKLRGTAFILIDVGVTVAIDGLPGWTDRCKGKGIGGGSGSDKVDLGTGGCKDFPNESRELMHGIFGTIGRFMACVGREEGLDNCRRCGAGIVGSEIHQLGSSMMWCSSVSRSASHSGMTFPLTETPTSWTVSGLPESRGCHGSRFWPL